MQLYVTKWTYVRRVILNHSIALNAQSIRTAYSVLNLSSVGASSMVGGSGSLASVSPAGYLVHVRLHKEVQYARENQLLRIPLAVLLVLLRIWRFQRKGASILIMKPRIETLAEKKLVGNRIKMSFSDNRTFELWRSFMPRRKEIRNSLGTDLYSVEVYPPIFFEKFSDDTEFEKWAAIEVTDFNDTPEQMERLTVPAGLYAVFVHRGPASTGSETYEYIFRSWLPGSDFTLDNRPHFALMGEKYKQNDQDSEEEIWIPIKQN